MLDRFKINPKKRVLFCTGAGASQESNIPTFRDSGGLWKTYDPKFLATASALDLDPISVNEFYNDRRSLLSTVEPNYFHYFITLMQDKYGSDRVGLITTNVDDLHERANTEDVLHLHGSLKEIVKYENGNKKVFNIGYRHVSHEEILCQKARPNVVMFGEGAYIKNDKVYNAYKDMDKIFSSLRKDDIVFIVGCSSVVVDFPYELDQAGNGCKVYTVNPNYTDKDIYKKEYQNIKMKACDSVPYIEDLIMENMNEKRHT